MQDIQRYSLSYRASETQQVMNWTRAGQCASIVGLRGSGKSNFIRFLMRPEAQQHYLGQDQDRFTFVLVNLLALSERSEWAVYEMIVNNLLMQLQSVDLTDEMIAKISAFHEEIMQNRGDVLRAQRAMERGIRLLCQQPTRQLVLLFDEFDAVFRDLPASLFRCLRAIRDGYKDQISYFVVATHDLADLRTDLDDEVDQFYRLVNRNLCWLGPYNEADALQMAEHLAFKRNQPFSKKEFTTLFELSYGHAGLLKCLLSLRWNGQLTGELPKAVGELVRESSVERECQKIWGNLSETEKNDLRLFASNAPIASQRHLLNRGLLRRNGEKIRVIFSPLFAEFVKQQALPTKPGTFIDRHLNIVQLDGRHHEDLAPLEFDILCHLYEHRGQTCSKAELIEAVYKQRYDDTSDEMLQALIMRLRKKIEPDPQHLRFIITVRHSGYRFGG